MSFVERLLVKRNEYIFVSLLLIIIFSKQYEFIRNVVNVFKVFVHLIIIELSEIGTVL